MCPAPNATFDTARQSEKTAPLQKPLSSSPHSSPIVSLSIDDTGTYLSTAHDDSSILVWTRDTQKSWRVEFHFRGIHRESQVTSLSWGSSRIAPMLLATCGKDSLAGVYCVRSKDDYDPQQENGGGDDSDHFLLHNAHVDVQTLRDAHDALECVSFSEDAVLGTLGAERILRVYSIGGCPSGGSSCTDWRIMASVDLFGGGVSTASGLSFRPRGGACIASGELVVQSLKNEWEWKVCRTEINQQRMGSDAIVAVHWGPAGIIVFGLKSGGIELWEVGNNGVHLVERVCHETSPEAASFAPVISVEWDSAGAVIVSAHSDGTLRTWARNPTELLREWKWGVRDTITLPQV